MNGFKRGSGCYNCESCGRQTRDTGAQSYGSKLCPQCYDLAGYYNMYQDGEEFGAGDKAAIFTYCQEIREKGGELDGDAMELLVHIGGGKLTDEAKVMLNTVYKKD